MRHKESRLQSECVRVFRLRHPDLSLNLFAVPNGVATSATQGRILKGEGLTAGVADVLLLVPTPSAHGLCLEFKTEEVTYEQGRKLTKRTGQRKTQRDWQAAVERFGYRYEVIRSWEEFEKVTESYLKENLANIIHYEQ